jgi:hypothetical protein
VSCAFHQCHGSRQSDIPYQDGSGNCGHNLSNPTVQFWIFFFGGGNTNMLFLRLSRGVKSGDQGARNAIYLL